MHLPLDFHQIVGVGQPITVNLNLAAETGRAIPTLVRAHRSGPCRHADNDKDTELHGSINFQVVDILATCFTSGGFVSMYS